MPALNFVRGVYRSLSRLQNHRIGPPRSTSFDTLEPEWSLAPYRVVPLYRELRVWTALCSSQSLLIYLPSAIC